MKVIRASLTILIAIGVLGGASFVAYLLLQTPPETTAEPEKQAAKIVQVIDLETRQVDISVRAWGSVIPAREVTMRPQVSGQVVEQHPSMEPGGRFKDGDLLVKMDPADYELNLTERKADLEQAKFESEVEQGRQKIAKREWEQLQKDLPKMDANPSLALREPQLRLTKAMIEKAENAIARAELDLKRTSISAPFNCMVTEETVEIGQLVESGSEICRLVGTDSFWVRATLPMAELNRVELPGGDTAGAEAKIFLDTGHGESEPWKGTVIRLLPDLEGTGRMARLLIEVEDPLRLEPGSDSNGAPLLLGSYVRVEIDAGSLEDVLSIPRTALHEGNRLWMVGPRNKVRIVEPEVLWTRPETVLVPDIRNPDERLIVSELKAALPGMEVNPQPLDGGGEEKAGAAE